MYSDEGVPSEARLARVGCRGQYIPKEKVVGIGWKTAVLEEPKQIVELAVDVAHKLERRLKLKERGLVAEVDNGLVDQEVDVVRSKCHICARLFCGRSDSCVQHKG